MKITNLSLAGLSLGVVALLFGSTETSSGYSLLGGSLGLDQRDVRVYNNFQDAAANNNTTVEADFPGYTGAELAIWKAATEWGSEQRGSTGLGDGGANFDITWQGNASGVGNTDNNIASSLASSCGGGVLAYVETPISNGWRMRFCEDWIWQDGPGGPGFGNNIDIQAVATHEYGHSLGLGHSNVSGATMYPSIQTATGARTIATDDINGVRAIYGLAAANKPSVSNVAVSGSQVTVTGSGFSATNNEVWFTNAGSSSTGSDARVIVTNVSSTGGGTQIVVNAPAGAGSGDLLVKRSGTGNSALSNAVGVDLGTGSGGTFSVDAISPASIDALIPGTDRTITVTGSGFAPTTTIAINGVPLPIAIPNPVQFNSATELVFDMPQIDSLGLVLITATEGSSSDTGFATVVAPATPKLQMGTGDIGTFIFQFAGVDVSYASQPGDLVYIVYSMTNLPSVWPGVLSLDLGNNFTSVPPVGAGLYAVPGRGWDSFNLPISGVTSLPTVYSQMVRLTGGPPYAASNLQEFVLF
ncbi:MAG: matrixin family metalloprotease [Planctomycetota bacterium]